MELYADLTTIAVTADDASMPTRLQLPGRPWVDVERVCNRWIVETDWWRPPVTNRFYFRVLVGRGGVELVDIYLDRSTGIWYVSRRYD